MGGRSYRLGPTREALCHSIVQRGLIEEGALGLAILCEDLDHGACNFFDGASGINGLGGGGGSANDQKW